MFRCEDEDTLYRALTKGPCVISGNYIAAQRWKPGFCASRSQITSTSVWVRIPDFPMEFYNNDILFTLGTCVGTPLKIDTTTFWASRGKYARICVEVGFTKPLLSKVMVERILFNLEYENFSAICFKCGRIGHRVNQCPTVLADALPEVVHGSRRSCMEVDPCQYPQPARLLPTYGPWMLVNKAKTRVNKSAPGPQPKAQVSMSSHVSHHYRFGSVQLEQGEGSRYQTCATGNPTSTPLPHHSLTVEHNMATLRDSHAHNGSNPVVTDVLGTFSSDFALDCNPINPSEQYEEQGGVLTSMQPTENTPKISSHHGGRSSQRSERRTPCRTSTSPTSAAGVGVSSDMASGEFPS